MKFYVTKSELVEPLIEALECKGLDLGIYASTDCAYINVGSGRVFEITVRNLSDVSDYDDLNKVFIDFMAEQIDFMAEQALRAL